jgi:hypothetical protein
LLTIQIIKEAVLAPVEVAEATIINQNALNVGLMMLNIMKYQLLTKKPKKRK